eukprot:scaffold65178_cov37-Prasinocladus_malaysianus.AAC.1
MYLGPDASPLHGKDGAAAASLLSGRDLQRHGGPRLQLADLVGLVVHRGVARVAPAVLAFARADAIREALPALHASPALGAETRGAVALSLGRRIVVHHLMQTQ